jgi:probable rRNA maturation factor
MIHIHSGEAFARGGDLQDVDIKALESAARAALEHLDFQEAVDLSIVITDDPGIQDYNRRYRGLDKPTDVLSFPSGAFDPDLERRYLGDVIISYQRAAAQAQASGHALDAELQLLVVHGVLHLGGFDHAADPDRSRMTAAQTEILARLDLDITPPQM